MKKETGIRFLFLLCWCSYFCAYIGRLNYSAALTDMIQSEGFGKGEAGLIGTAFFFAYGAGQFVSGFLGDRLPAKWLVFMGLFCSSICNLLMSQSSNIGIMIGVWCVNGLVQALIWSPMLRLVTDYCKAEVRPKLCAALNSAVPVGTMAAYGVTAAVLGMSGWRSVFLLGGGCLFIMSFVWFWGITRVQRTMPVQEKQIPASTAAGAQQNTAGGMDMRLGRILLQSGLVLLLAALFVQGALKDGVTTWIPVYIQETYGVSPILAVAGTMVIPLCNLFGVWLAAAACRHGSFDGNAGTVHDHNDDGEHPAHSGASVLLWQSRKGVVYVRAVKFRSVFRRRGIRLRHWQYGRIFWLDSHDFNLGGDGGSLCLNLRHRCEKMGYLPQKTCGRRTLKRY